MSYLYLYSIPVQGTRKVNLATLKNLKLLAPFRSFSRSFFRYRSFPPPSALVREKPNQHAAGAGHGHGAPLPRLCHAKPQLAVQVHARVLATARAKHIQHESSQWNLVRSRLSRPVPLGAPLSMPTINQVRQSERGLHRRLLCVYVLPAQTQLHLSTARERHQRCDGGATSKCNLRHDRSTLRFEAHHKI